jgi:hypothetical protein
LIPFIFLVNEYLKYKVILREKQRSSENIVYLAGKRFGDVDPIEVLEKFKAYVDAKPEG